LEGVFRRFSVEVAKEEAQANSKSEAIATASTSATGINDFVKNCLHWITLTPFSAVIGFNAPVVGFQTVTVC